ncbi:hypothetical protein TNCV_730081 [Trichonephila clavipes]|nr:hypothetical protein TNCV_730081 [Trichonephila clavipes]
MRLPQIAKIDLVQQRVVNPGPNVVQAWTKRFRLAIDQENKYANEAIQSVGRKGEGDGKREEIESGEREEPALEREKGLVRDWSGKTMNARGVENGI